MQLAINYWDNIRLIKLYNISRNVILGNLVEIKLLFPDIYTTRYHFLFDLITGLFIPFNQNVLNIYIYSKIFLNSFANLKNIIFKINVLQLY